MDQLAELKKLHHRTGRDIVIKLVDYRGNSTPYMTLSKECCEALSKFLKGLCHETNGQAGIYRPLDDNG